MTGRVLSFAKSSHQKTQELLPWLVNGTLEGEEAVEVEQHLRSCPACREELESLRVMRSAYVESELAPGAEAALARLRPRLDEAVPASPSPDRIRAQPGRPGQMPVWVKLALAAQFGAIFALGWGMLQPDRTGLEYHALAASAPARPVGSLVVVFDPETPQRDVARILRQSGARIVDGPTASNGLVLSVERGDLQAALARLRAERAVVLAEPLQAAETR